MTISSCIIIPSRTTCWNKRPLTNYDVTRTSRYATNRRVIWFDNLFKHKIWWWHIPHIRWNRWVYPEWHACPQRAGQAYWCILQTPSDATSNDTHFQVMPEIFIYILLSPDHCSKLQLRYLSSQRTYSPNYRDLNHVRSCAFHKTSTNWQSLRNLAWT